MSEEHPNVTAYRKAADAFRARDLQAIAALVERMSFGTFRVTTLEPGTSAAAMPCWRG